MADMETTQTSDIMIKPSGIARLTEDEIGDALRRIREEAKQIEEKEQLEELRELRAQLNQRLDELLKIHMAALDGDPEVNKIIDQLTQLSLGITSAVKEIRDFNSAVEKGTKILGYADRFLSILKEFSGIFV